MRTLKIEITGDFYRRKTVPKIRLQGKWLEAQGFPPGGRVAVIPAPGNVLLLKAMVPKT